MGGSYSTHIANGCSLEIEARVTGDTEHLKSSKVSANIGVGFAKTSGKAGFSEEKEYVFFDQHPGFVKIQPGHYLDFHVSGYDGMVYVTITSGSKVIADNFPMENGKNVIVDAEGYVQNAKDGEIWIDESGNNLYKA